MSEKIREVKSTRRVHEIYCDRCNKKIMESEELDDGWWETPDALSVSVYINDWYKYERCLCEDYKKEETEQIIDKLTNMGFVKEYWFNE